MASHAKSRAHYTLIFPQHLRISLGTKPIICNCLLVVEAFDTGELVSAGHLDHILGLLNGSIAELC